MNLPNDQFLISGGSIDKYLKNNINNTPKGTSLAQLPQEELKQQNAPSAQVPVMSNLIIAMALQNNFTAGQESTANLDNLNANKARQRQGLPASQTQNLPNYNADKRPTPYSNQMQLPFSGQSSNMQVQQPLSGQQQVQVIPQSMTPSARTLQSMSKSQVDDAINHMFTNDSAFAY